MGITEEITDGLGLESVTERLEGLFQEHSVSVTDFFTNIMTGNLGGALEAAGAYLSEVFAAQWQGYRSIFAAVLIIGILSAVFSEFGKVFENRQIADISYYIIYLMMIMVLLGLVQQEIAICREALTTVSDFTRILVPAYCLSVGLAAGQTTSVFFYETALLMLFVIEKMLLVIVVPLIYTHSFLAVMNGINQEGQFEGLGKLLQKIVQLLLKGSITLVSGLSLLQGMIMPVIDRMKVGSVQKLVSLVPGIGGMVSTAADVVYGSAVLVKNAIGVTGILLLLLLCAAPVIRLLFMVVLLRLAGAVVSMVADKRMNRCIEEVAESGHMLLMTLLAGMTLFIVSIAIIAVSTNRGF